MHTFKPDIIAKSIVVSSYHNVDEFDASRCDLLRVFLHRSNQEEQKTYTVTLTGTSFCLTLLQAFIGTVTNTSVEPSNSPFLFGPREDTISTFPCAVKYQAQSQQFPEHSLRLTTMLV